ncbi:MAG: IS4 family transposase [Proteobacteria bacterium]|nr:IS4 family transposase [Pseudomonadota bacterium]
MYTGKIVFSQLIDHLPMHTFRKCIKHYQGNRYVKSFSCLDQFLCMAFAQLTFRESLRDVEACLRAHNNKIYHMGIRGTISKSTLADANENRNWQIYSDFAQSLIQIARPLYVDEDLGFQLDNTAYALDSSTIDLCMSVFPWALFRSTKSGIKLHTLLDIRGSIPTFIHISDANLHDVNILDILPPEPGSFYIMDRGYVDFKRLYNLNKAGSFFVTRTKSNTCYKRRYSHEIDKSGNLKCDQTIVLTGVKTSNDYPQSLRRVKYYDKATDKTFNFLTNNFSVPAQTVADLYRNRWQVELFFKWIKQHLRVKSFFGTSENAVKTQIWIAISVYVLVAIIKKRFKIEASLYTILQILSLTLFEKRSLKHVLTFNDYKEEPTQNSNQLNFFDFLTGH